MIEDVNTMMVVAVVLALLGTVASLGPTHVHVIIVYCTSSAIGCIDLKKKCFDEISAVQIWPPL